MAPLRNQPLRPPPTTALDGDMAMLDILLLGLGVGTFALMAAYVRGCERV